MSGSTFGRPGSNPSGVGRVRSIRTVRSRSEWTLFDHAGGPTRDRGRWQWIGGSVTERQLGRGDVEILEPADIGDTGQVTVGAGTADPAPPTGGAPPVALRIVEPRLLTRRFVRLPGQVRNR